MHSVKTILVAVTLAALATACKMKKDGDGASAKSLEDLAHKPGAAAPGYRCGTKYAGGGALSAYVQPLAAQVEPADSPLKDALLGTAQALPAPIALLIAGTHTRIRLVANAATECAGTPFSASEKDVTGQTAPAQSCWRQKAAGERPELILQADEAVIQHSFVRLGAYLYAEFLHTRVSAPNPPAPFNSKEWQDAAKAFDAARTGVAAALLADLKNFDDQVSAKFTAMNAKDPVAFGNIAVAEAQDSYYCSDASRTAFQSLFRATYAVFADAGNPQSMVGLFGTR